MKKIYYAHSMKIYDSIKEKDELRFLKRKYKKENVVCPNNDLGELGDIERYKKFIKRNCKAVVASEYKNCIGRGVYEELKTALTNKIPCFLIRKTKTGRRSVKPIKSIRVNNKWDWKVEYGKVEIAN